MKAQQRFTLVDALRGIAALSVVLFHAREGGHLTELMSSLPRPVESAIGHGDLGVAIFFVLSGFVIAHSLSDKAMTASVFARFTLRRSLRLDPPYWAAIVLCIAFGLLASAVLKGRPAEPYSLQQLAAHAFYVQDILGYQQINVVFWTLCLEIQFYLVYAALLALARTRPDRPLRGPTAILLAGAGAVSLLWPLGLGPEVPRGTFPPLWHGFLLGVGVYWAWRERGAMPWFLAYAALVAAGAFANDAAFSIACVATALVLLAAALAGRLHTGLNWRWLQGLGLVSYSLYLSHNPITGATFRVGYMLTGRTAATEALWWAVSTAACIAFAAAMWWAIERPSISIARRVELSSGRRRPLRGGAATQGA